MNETEQQIYEWLMYLSKKAEDKAVISYKDRDEGLGDYYFDKYSHLRSAANSIKNGEHRK